MTSIYDDMPVTTVLRSETTGTTYIKTHHVPPLDWLMVPRGRRARRVASTALAAIFDLVEMKAVTR